MLTDFSGRKLPVPNIFGKTLEQLVGDGMQTKALKMTDESQQKLQDTMEKIINESNGGLVCIII